MGCAAAELDVADEDDDADDDDDDDGVDDFLLQPPTATPNTNVVAARPTAITEFFIAFCSSG